jgi:hypothetical protein
MKIKNGYSYDKNGWKYVSIKGKPKERDEEGVQPAEEMTVPGGQEMQEEKPS